MRIFGSHPVEPRSRLAAEGLMLQNITRVRALSHACNGDRSAFFKAIYDVSIARGFCLRLPLGSVLLFVDMDSSVGGHSHPESASGRCQRRGKERGHQPARRSRRSSGNNRARRLLGMKLSSRCRNDEQSRRCDGSRAGLHCVSRCTYKAYANAYAKVLRRNEIECMSRRTWTS
jgi:hypothetical protein